MTHTVAVGLTWGDEGKGGLVDFLCSPHAPERARLVVRFNGGVNAGHNVVLPDGRHHCFAQFGSGTLQGARTHLSRFMLLDPLALAAEADVLTSRCGITDPFQLITVDPRALIITPYHVAVNQQREQDRGAARHGSCGMGIWETASFAIGYPEVALRAGHLTSHRQTAGRLREIRAIMGVVGGLTFDDDVGEMARRYVRIAAQVTQAYDRELLAGALEVAPAVFEGAQGVLLDQDLGTRPYVTGSTTTFANADELLTEAGHHATRIGVIRSYMTRHGPGPFPTEAGRLTRDELPEPHNTTGRWQRAFRWGDLDLEAVRYALTIAPADALAMTHCDAPDRVPLRLCTSYGPAAPSWRPGYGPKLANSIPRWEIPAPAVFPSRVAELLGRPLAFTSYGPTAEDKHAELGGDYRTGSWTGRQRQLWPGTEFCTTCTGKDAPPTSGRRRGDTPPLGRA
jgi:adenylosuccinate synthase